METPTQCPECGAPWPPGKTCQDDFSQMGAWEIEHPDVYPHTHHLMVLCYYIQHPSLYSPEGLEEAKYLLADFVAGRATPQQVLKRDRSARDSGRRKFKIKGTPDRHGAYAHPVRWAMTAADVTAGSLDRYVENIQAWARSVLEALKASGNYKEPT